MSIFDKTSSADFQIDSLDGLRGFAMVLVLLSHTSTAFGTVAGINFTGAGKYGVYLFFTLSSFLLSLPLLTGADLFSRATWTRYAKRRFFRIYPLFASVLAINYLLHRALGLDLYIHHTPHEVIKALLLIEEKGVFWSIAVEFKFYLLLPFIAIVFKHVLRKNTLHCAMLVIAVCAATGLMLPAATYPENSISLVPYLPIFLFGSLGALIYSKIRDAATHEVHPLTTPLPYISLCMIIATIPAFWGAITGTEVSATHFHKSYYFYGVLWPLFMLSFLMKPGMITRAFSSRPIRFLGFVSFSAYLWHEFVIGLVRNLIGADGQKGVALVFIATLLLSAISYLIFERPFIIKRPERKGAANSGLSDSAVYPASTGE